MVKSTSKPLDDAGRDADHELGQDASPAIRPGTLTDGPVRGRGAQLNPPNRFEKLSLHVLGEHLDTIAQSSATDGPAPDAEPLFHDRQLKTTVYRDTSRTLINPVNSPDISFDWSINPYRGCEHGCIYCYARPGHEFLGMSSGIDFESKIMAKLDAPDLLRRELAHPSWRGEVIALSGVTDCYQPIEARLEITRKCLTVMAEAHQAVSIVTKSRLVLRDLDLLQDLARFHAVSVAVSLTTLDNQLASKMEPRAASPRDRLWTIQRLASAGIPVTVMVAPIIPAINDREMPAILKAAAEAGATSAGYVLLRLPHQIKDLFDDWLARHFPDRADHVQSLLRQSHGGKLYDASFHTRQTGEGPYAHQIRQAFNVFKTRYNLSNRSAPLETHHFRPPATDNQLALFA
jgi:DNA repair photolyase